MTTGKLIVTVAQGEFNGEKVEQCLIAVNDSTGAARII